MNHEALTVANVSPLGHTIFLFTLLYYWSTHVSSVASELVALLIVSLGPKVMHLWG